MDGLDSSRKGRTPWGTPTAGIIVDHGPPAFAGEPAATKTAALRAAVTEARAELELTLKQRHEELKQQEKKQR
eukprot:SAG11_NODE_845_length_6885_cov_6.782346_6_plen_73_part_00